MRFILLAPVAMFLGTLALHGGDEVALKKELMTLQGTWKLVAAKDGEQGIDKVPPFTLQIRADGTAKVSTDEGESSATLSLDPAKKPKTLDLVHQDGKAEGKKQYLIYKVENDKLMMMGTTPGGKAADRPRDFTDSTKSKLLIFERVRSDKKP
jgi:uncharacterized protein (TIGR03067 family)